MTPNLDDPTPADAGLAAPGPDGSPRGSRSDAPHDPRDDSPGDSSEGTPPDDHPGTDWRWWIALALAVAFLVGAVGYVIGTRVTDSADDLSTVDIGFLQDMTDHHDQAVVLSLLANAGATDPIVRDFAMENVIFQRYQIGQMTELLANDGLGRGDEDRLVMEWMDMPTPLADMPGLASDAELEALGAATGDEANRLFLELMREHHQGGLHMAQYAADNGKSPRVRALAAQMARNQAIEVEEYTHLMERLGFE